LRTPVNRPARTWNVATVSRSLAVTLPWLWLCGSPITFALLAAGLIGAERLRRQSRVLDSGEIPILCRALAKSLRITRDVAIGVCDRIAAPVLIGVVRPMILLPPAALSGWTMEQLEMVLCHELAHLRRWDNLVNLLQRVVESLLFFHPVVWWVSAWARLEREHCCDAAVVAQTGRARAYVETLAALSGSAARQRAAFVAMAENEIVARVRRILNIDETPMTTKLPRAAVACAAAMVVAPAFFIAAVAQPAARSTDTATRKEAPSAQAKGSSRARLIEDLGKAVQSAEALANLEARSEALRNLAAAQAEAGERETAATTFTKAIRAAEEIKELYGKAWALRFSAVGQAKAGDAPGAKATFASALRAADALDRDRRVNYRELIATGQAEAGDTPGARATLRASLEIVATMKDDKNKWYNALHHTVRAMAKVGDFDVALDAAEALPAEQSHLRDPLLRDVADGAESADPAIARRVLERALKIAATINADVPKSLSLAGIAEAQAKTGDIDGALKTAHAIGEGAHQFDVADSKPLALGPIAIAQAEAGDKGGARRTLDEALKVALALEKGIIKSERLEVVAIAQAKTGDIEGAQTTVEAIGNEHDYKALALTAVGRAQLKAGKRVDALDTFRRAVGTRTNLRELAVAQAEAGAIEDALWTVDAIPAEGNDRPSALDDIATAQARTGDFTAALRTAKSIEDGFFKAYALEHVARIQAEAGRETDALAWASELDDLAVRARVLRAVGEGIAQRARQPKAEKKAAAPKVESSIARLIQEAKDRDPAVRLAAIKALGEIDPEAKEAREARFALSNAAHRDKDTSVRAAASQALDESKFRTKRERDEFRKRVGPKDDAAALTDLEPGSVKVTLQVVDGEGRPVADADVGRWVHNDEGEKTWWAIDDRPSRGRSRVRSDGDGRAVFTLELSDRRREVAFYALQAARGWVGILSVDRLELNAPQTLVVGPACRVRVALTGKGLSALAEQFKTPLEDLGHWKAAYVTLGDDYGRDPSPLFASSHGRPLEFMLPPGNYQLRLYGSNFQNVLRDIAIERGQRELDLGTIDLPPTEQAKQGHFERVSRFLGKGITLFGNSIGTNAIALSPDSRLLATAHWYNADPSEIKLWDLEMGEPVATLPGTQEPVHAIAFAPDGRALASASNDGTITEWVVATRQPQRTYRGHTKGVLTVAYSNDGTKLASGGWGCEVRIWETATGTQIGQIADLPGIVRAVPFSPDGKLLAIAAGESVTLWDVATRNKHATLAGASFWPWAAAFSPDSKTLASAGAETKDSKYMENGVEKKKKDRALVRAETRLWDLATGREIRRLAHDEPDPRRRNKSTGFDSSVAFSPDGKLLVIVNMGELEFRDTATGALRDLINHPVGSSADVAQFSKDGSLLVTMIGGRPLVRRVGAK
jgi:beta-lactamase regulating signal transducer with metallopeptidase domain/Tol biopolymer transport system component